MGKGISMNYDLVEMFREKLDDFTISDYYGLNSPGLTCYLNSVLQVLFMTEDFREAVKRCCSKDSSVIDPYLERLFSDLQKSVAKTHNITLKLGITNVYEQRDASEYFEKILCLTSPEAAKLFKGELSHKIMCLKCQASNDSRSFFWTLPLAVGDSCRQTYSVEKGLKAFFKGEEVRGDNKVYCNRCDKKQDAHMRCEITQNPKILTLLLKRFTFDKDRCYKVDVPRTLHVKDCKYDLYAIVNHFSNLTGGHYTAHIKSFETHVWYHFNDDSVKLVKPLFGAEDEYLRSGTAYLLMYRKVSRYTKKNNESNKEAVGAHSDVKAERRHGKAQRGGETSVPYYRQPKDKSCNRGESLKHLNGDLLKMTHADMVLKKMPNVSGEMTKQPFQRATWVRPRREVLLRTDTATDGDDSQTQRSNPVTLEKDGRQKNTKPNREQLETNTKKSVNTHYLACMSEQNHESEKRRLKTNESVREMHNRIIARTGKMMSEADRVKPARVKMKATSKQRKEARVGNEESVHLAPSCPSSSSVSFLTTSSSRHKRVSWV